jgi:PAS domain S-box-containing protein
MPVGRRSVPSDAVDLVSAAVVELMDGLPNAVGSVKDVDGRYVHVTAGFAELVGRTSSSAVLGLTVHDLFPADLAASYAGQDARVLATGRPLHDHLEVIEHADGTRRWYVTSKVRLLAPEPVGVASMSVDVRSPDDGEVALRHRGLAAALDHVRSDLTRRTSMGELASIAGVTTAQLDRTCRRAFGASMTALLQRMRLDEALHRLTHTADSLGDLAAACGFYDQSELSRRFKSATGTTPARYREQHRIS